MFQCKNTLGLGLGVEKSYKCLGVGTHISIYNFLCQIFNI